MRERFFMDGRYFNWAVRQNPCGCHPLDLLIETKNTGFTKCITISGFKTQKEVEQFLKKKIHI